MKFDHLELEFAGFDLREIENVVDQVEQAERGALRHEQVFALLRIQLGIEDQLRHAENAIHRRPDFVAHVREKLALYPGG